MRESRFHRVVKPQCKGEFRKVDLADPVLSKIAGVGMPSGKNWEQSGQEGIWHYTWWMGGRWSIAKKAIPYLHLCIGIKCPVVFE